MKRWIAIAGLVGVAVAIALATRGGDAPAAAAREIPPSAETEIPAVEVKPPVEQAPNAPIVILPEVDEVLETAVPSETLFVALTSTDAVVVAEAANGLVARGDVAVLPQLRELDVIARPWAAPSIIHAMGRLGAIADDVERGATVDRLVALMAEEKRRGAPESLGNLIQIYEALGDTRDPRAIGPLERELRDTSVQTAPKVTIVQALVMLGARESRPALERLRDLLEPTIEGTDFEAALRRDLLAAIREALVQLS